MLGGTVPTVYNAANEVAVNLFLAEKIGFLEMAEVVAHAMDIVPRRNVEAINDVLDADKEARIAVNNLFSSPRAMIR